MKNFVSQVYAGKTIGRILFNRLVEERCKALTGRVLDLASGKNPSYHILLPRGLDLIAADQEVSFDEPLPYASSSFDAVLFFNAIYIVRYRTAVLGEIRRVLKPNGLFFLSSPFSSIETPEPHDFCRLTAEGLERELGEAGFREISVARFGERFTSAVNLVSPFLLFNTMRLIAFALALGLDRLIPEKLRAAHPAPLGYFCTAL